MIRRHLIAQLYRFPCPFLSKPEPCLSIILMLRIEPLRCVLILACRVICYCALQEKFTQVSAWFTAQFFSFTQK